MTSRILVLGGSGFVGRHLIERLQRRGDAVTVPTRRRVSARMLWHLPCVDLVEADVTRPGVLEELVPGHDAAVNLVATLHGSPAEFERVHDELPRRLAAVCAAAGMPRVVHVSALGAGADAPSRYLRSRAAGEAALQQAVAAGMLDLTVLRPSVIYGAGDRFLSLFTGLQRWLPIVPLAAANARFQPVWVRDVAQALVRCLDDGAAIGQTFEICGPEVFTLRELVRLCGQWAGVREGRGRPVLGMPGPLARMQALFFEALPGTPLLTRDNLDSMKRDNVAGKQLPGLAALGIRPASLAATGPMILGSGNPAARLDMLRRSAGR